MQVISQREKRVREWINKYWNTPEMGGWVCRRRIKMRPRWKDTVESIRQMYPTNSVVNRWDDSKGEACSSLRNTVKQDEALGDIPEGLTHRAVWNASVRAQRWLYQTDHARETGAAVGIAHMCPGCNSELDMRAVLCAETDVARTECPRCGLQQDDQTPWWPNPPLDRRTVVGARERMNRSEDPGPDIPRAKLGGSQWHAMPTRVRPPHLLESPMSRATCWDRTRRRPRSSKSEQRTKRQPKDSPSLESRLDPPLQRQAQRGVPRRMHGRRGAHGRTRQPP